MTKTPLQMRRVLFDATSTLHTGYVTGIQRVVLSLEKQMQLDCKERGVVFETLYYNGKDYLICKPGMRKSLSAKRRYLVYARLIKRLLILCAKIVGGVFWVFYKPMPLFLRKRIHQTKMIVFMKKAVDRIRRSIFFRSKRAFEFLTSIPDLFLRKKWVPTYGDVLFLADATWNYEPWQAVRAARQAGVSVHTIVYDLLPLKHPDFFQPQLVRAFERWWDCSCENSSSFMCISQAVQGDVEKRFDRVKRPCPVFVFPLGFDFVNTAPVCVQKPLEGMPIDWEKDRLFLAVGTLEPRKNHGAMLDAFDRVWAQSQDFKLIIVGRKGWLSEALVERIEKHPLYGTSLFWVSNGSDADLDALYAASDCLIAASFDEGYGLPIIESAARGIPALVSDIPVFHEVSFSSTRFFDLKDPDSLAQQILATEKSMNKKEAVLATTFPSWADASRAVFLNLRHAARFAEP